MVLQFIKCQKVSTLRLIVQFVSIDPFPSFGNGHGIELCIDGAPGGTVLRPFHNGDIVVFPYGFVLFGFRNLRYCRVFFFLRLFGRFWCGCLGSFLSVSPDCIIGHKRKVRTFSAAPGQTECNHRQDQTVDNQTLHITSSFGIMQKMSDYGDIIP